MHNLIASSKTKLSFKNLNLSKRSDSQGFDVMNTGNMDLHISNFASGIELSNAQNFSVDSLPHAFTLTPKQVTNHYSVNSHGNLSYYFESLNLLVVAGQSKISTYAFDEQNKPYELDNQTFSGEVVQSITHAGDFLIVCFLERIVSFAVTNDGHLHEQHDYVTPYECSDAIYACGYLFVSSNVAAAEDSGCRSYTIDQYGEIALNYTLEADPMWDMVVDEKNNLLFVCGYDWLLRSFKIDKEGGLNQIDVLCGYACDYSLGVCIMGDKLVVIGGEPTGSDVNTTVCVTTYYADGHIDQNNTAYFTSFVTEAKRLCITNDDNFVYIAHGLQGLLIYGIDHLNHAFLIHNFDHYRLKHVTLAHEQAFITGSVGYDGAYGCSFENTAPDEGYKVPVNIRAYVTDKGQTSATCEVNLVATPTSNNPNSLTIALQASTLDLHGCYLIDQEKHTHNTLLEQYRSH